MTASTVSELFDLIAQLVDCHSPSGEEGEIDAWLLDRLRGVRLDPQLDDAGNITVLIPGRDRTRTLAITAHKDEIGAVVNQIEPGGRVRVRKLGGAFPWVYGEGAVDLLGDHGVVTGILSFGSRHVSHESPQKCFQEDASLKWEHVWIETKRTTEELALAGIRPGSRMVVGRHRKAPLRLGEAYIASYTLDNKASIAVLLLLAERLQQPAVDVQLVFSAKEEVGALGALHFTHRTAIDELIALEICPKSKEYPLTDDRRPVLISQDGYGLYDEDLNRRLAAAARTVGIEVQHLILNGFGSDATLVMKNGHVPKAACLGFPTENTHGYEIAHGEGILNCLAVLEAHCRAIPG